MFWKPVVFLVTCIRAARRVALSVARRGMALLQVFISESFRYAPLLTVRQRRSGMINFKGSQFEREIILWGVRWYVAYPISYRQLTLLRNSLISAQRLR